MRVNISFAALGANIFENVCGGILGLPSCCTNVSRTSGPEEVHCNSNSLPVAQVKGNVVNLSLLLNLKSVQPTLSNT